MTHDKPRPLRPAAARCGVILVVAALSVGAQPGPMRAQPAGDRNSPEAQAGGVAEAPSLVRLGGCFRGRPLPRCRSFWITEAHFGYQMILTGQFSGPYHGWEMDAEVGWMRHRDARSALGGAVAFGAVSVSRNATFDFSDFGEFVSLRPRYRRWLSPTTSLDASLGARWTPGALEIIEARAALSYGDVVGVWTQVWYNFGQDTFAWVAGIQGGSYLGLTAYAAVIGLVLYYFFSFDPS